MSNCGLCRATPAVQNVGMRLLGYHFGRLKSWLSSQRGFDRYHDSYSLTRQGMATCLAAAIDRRKKLDAAILLVVHFQSTFIRAQEFLEQFNIDYQVSGATVRPEDLAEFGRGSKGSVLLTLAGSLDDMSLARNVLPQAVDLSVMVLERHPIPSEDSRIEAVCRLWPFHMRLGYFLALDDAVQCRCIHPTTVVLLQQLGLRDHELITSHMLTQRIETVLAREALQNKSQRLAESPEQWFEFNRS